MAMKITNTSAKVIGIGDVTALPGETAEVPPAFETSPILEVYKNMGFITLSGEPEADQKDAEKADAEAEAKVEADAKAQAEAKAEADRKAKLASLKNVADEDVAALAKELGVNPAECKDLADVRKKVKAALSK